MASEPGIDARPKQVARSDVDYFTFAAPHAGVLVVETTGSTDTRGTVWQDGVEVAHADSGGRGQNFRLAIRVAAGPLVIAVRGNGRQTGRYTLQTALVLSYLENPAPVSFQSGLRVISGWRCAAEEVVIEIDGQPIAAAAGTERADTLDRCGDVANGFGLLVNWAEFGAGAHEVVALVDRVELSRATVTVTVVDATEPYVRGLAKRVAVTGFPTPEETVTLEWQTAQQNFVITGVD